MRWIQLLSTGGSQRMKKTDPEETHKDTGAKNGRRVVTGLAMLLVLLLAVLVISEKSNYRQRRSWGSTEALKGNLFYRWMNATAATLTNMSSIVCYNSKHVPVIQAVPFEVLDCRPNNVTNAAEGSNTTAQYCPLMCLIYFMSPDYSRLWLGNETGPCATLDGLLAPAGSVLPPVVQELPGMVYPGCFESNATDGEDLGWLPLEQCNRTLNASGDMPMPGKQNDLVLATPDLATNGTVAVADVFWYCGDGKVRQTLLPGWKGRCAMVMLTSGITILVPKTESAHGIAKRSVKQDDGVWITSTGWPVGIPQEILATSHVSTDYGAIHPWVQMHRNAHWINHAWYNQQRFMNRIANTEQLHAASEMTLHNRFVRDITLAEQQGMCQRNGYLYCAGIPMHTAEDGKLTKALNRLRGLSEELARNSVGGRDTQSGWDQFFSSPWRAMLIVLGIILGLVLILGMFIVGLLVMRRMLAAETRQHAMLPTTDKEGHVSNNRL